MLGSVDVRVSKPCLWMFMHVPSISKLNALFLQRVSIARH